MSTYMVSVVILRVNYSSCQSPTLLSMVVLWSHASDNLFCLAMETDTGKVVESRARLCCWRKSTPRMTDEFSYSTMLCSYACTYLFDHCRLDVVHDWNCLLCIRCGVHSTAVCCMIRSCIMRIHITSFTKHRITSNNNRVVCECHVTILLQQWWVGWLLFKNQPTGSS